MIEYKITKVRTEETLTSLEEHLNELGRNDWEVYHHHEVNLDQQPTILCFSRRRQY